MAKRKSNVTIRWVLPPDIVEGTPLDEKLLNAVAFDDKGNETDETSSVYFVGGKDEALAKFKDPTRTLPIFATGPNKFESQAHSPKAGPLTLTVLFLDVDDRTTVLQSATRMTYIQPRDLSDLPSKPQTDLKQSWNRLLNDPSIPGAVAELFLARVNTTSGGDGGNAGGDSEPKQEQRAAERIVSAIKGSDAVMAAVKAPTGELIVEVRVENEYGKEEPLTRETLKSFPLQVLDEFQNLAATSFVVEEGRIRYPNVRAGLFMLAFSAEIGGPDGDLDDEYHVREAGSSSFEKRTRIPNWLQSTDVAQNADQARFDKGTLGEKRLRANPFPQNIGAYTSVGQTTTMRIKLRTPTARVRCFSTLSVDDSCGCSTGKQYVAEVPISVLRGEVLLHSNTTGNSGSTAFKLSPGWYTFKAPQDLTIEGCKYALSSSSPVSAFVSARQGCSDIHFCYGRKGTEIQVGTFVVQPTTSDPNSAIVDEPLPDIQYLLLREGDPAFAQQQLASAGEAVFSNLPAGTYWLFFQAPATYKSLPIKPAFPYGGRMALTTFAGQTTPIPVRAKYTSLNAVPPADLNGYLRDDYGNAVPQQLVKIVNNSGVVVAAALTDEQGYYSILIYEAENLQIVAGAQQQTVSRSQIAAALQATPAVTLPPLARELAQTNQNALLLSGQ